MWLRVFVWLNCTAKEKWSKNTFSLLCFFSFMFNLCCRARNRPERVDQPTLSTPSRLLQHCRTLPIQESAAPTTSHQTTNTHQKFDHTSISFEISCKFFSEAGSLKARGAGWTKRLCKRKFQQQKKRTGG